MGEKKFKTTKADERAALELIRSILAELDPAGDVNIAFDGCCDIAESNINNDLDCSYKKMFDVMFKRNEHLQEKLEESYAVQRDLQAQLNASNKSRDTRKEMLDAMSEVNEHLKSENKKLQIENELLQAQIHSISATLKKANAYLLDLLNGLK